MAGSFQSRLLGDFWQTWRSLAKSGAVNTMSVSSGSNCSGAGMAAPAARAREKRAASIARGPPTIPPLHEPPVPFHEPAVLNPNPARNLNRFMVPMRGRKTVEAPPEPRFAKDLAMILPLPFRRGEGWGEESVCALGFRGAKRVNLSGEALPFRRGEGRGEGSACALPFRCCAAGPGSRRGGGLSGFINSAHSSTRVCRVRLGGSR